MQAPDTHSDLAVHEELLLRICAAPDCDHGALMRLLDTDGWNSLAQTAEDKRLCALVLRAVGIADARKLLPPAAAARLEAARHWHSIYALKQMAAVKRLIGVLGEGGFNPVLLKGFGLAHGIYPDPALRPLRDVDLLLSAEEAARAQELLIGNPHYRVAPWAGSYGLEFGHQLPEIQDIDFELTIELHHRINARNWAQEPILLELIRAEPVSLTVMGIDVRVPSPRANFLHLLEHATLHHAFENGPLVLADLHFLAARSNLDWDYPARSGSWRPSPGSMAGDGCPNDWSTCLKSARRTLQRPDQRCCRIESNPNRTSSCAALRLKAPGPPAGARPFRAP